MYKLVRLSSPYDLRDFLNKEMIEPNNVVSFSKEDGYHLPWTLVYFEPKK